MAEEKIAPVIVIKKKKGHAGAHGGAWKVAYADFVTAMMAFFMVMWLMNSSTKVQEAVGGYFRDPSGAGKQSGSSMAGTGDGIELKKDDLSKLKDELDKAMKKMPEFDQLKDNISMTVTGEGLRVELLETEKGLFFESGNMKPSERGEELLVLLAHQLGELPNHILIEGHTDARPFKSEDGYGNWELSVDRANAARKLMQATGLRADQVVQVRGFADQHLRDPNDPHAAGNRRISVIVQYLQPKPGEAPPAAEAAKPEGGGGGHGAPPAKH
ncbi:MAG: OmpA family protein [Bryobacterales bacterium]|nr:OmpA family protein [Bryobacterales bacterium]